MKSWYIASDTNWLIGLWLISEEEFFVWGLKFDWYDGELKAGAGGEEFVTW